LGLTLAGPILPLYWVKPPGVSKLIGTWQILFWGRRILLRESSIEPSQSAEVKHEGTLTKVLFERLAAGGMINKAFSALVCSRG
jgi:hypothetical protein